MASSVSIRKRTERIPFRRRAALLSAAAVALTLPIAAAGPAVATPAPTPREPAVPTLDWQACGDGFDCATATVPLDYAHPTGDTIQIAMIRHPATDPAHRIGSVFFNPGGPGGPGTDALRQAYPIFPPTMRARFDLVSFDPRGIGHSTGLHCFDNPAQEQQLLSQLPTGFPVGAAEERTWERTYADFGKSCSAHAGPLLAHDTTADVARDMDLMRQAVGDAKMNYLGISYGSYLGATYANLFPDKVRAITLDGDVDPIQWSTGTDGSARRLNTFLRMGSDRASARSLNAFLDLCGQAPVSSCAFSAGSPAATHAKFDTLLDRLASHPVVVDGQTVTRAAALSEVVGGMYTAEPIPGGLSDGWAPLAEQLQQAWAQTTGAAPTTSAKAPSAKAPSAPAIRMPLADVTPAAQPGAAFETQLGVECSESPNPRNPAAYPVDAAFATARSGVVGPAWAWIDEACSTWPVFAPQRYSGPWNKPTSAPILLVGTTFDPATPYEGSIAESHELANARLLTLNGYGHTALVNPSSCVQAAEDAYFVSGTLPAPGTVCQQDRPPFTG